LIPRKHAPAAAPESDSAPKITPEEDGLLWKAAMEKISPGIFDPNSVINQMPLLDKNGNPRKLVPPPSFEEHPRTPVPAPRPAPEPEKPKLTMEEVRKLMRIDATSRQLPVKTANRDLDRPMAPL
jgi:hypothetical protein